MSDSVSENRAYFVKALNEAINRKMEEEMADCREDASTSLRHKIIMKKIAKGKCFEETDKVRITKRTILIAIIAAMLALTSCALVIIYREKIGGFIESIYQDCVHISPDSKSTEEENQYPKEIERIYEFTYIPEGYEFKKGTTYYFSVVNIYEDADGNELKLKQEIVSSADFKTNSQNSYRKAFDVGDKEVYCRSDILNNYVCQTYDYVFQIHSEEKLSEDELQKIIMGIK